MTVQRASTGAKVVLPRSQAAFGRRRRRVVLSLAPMMELTDRHFRYLLRQITERTLLYTEMITAQAVMFGDQERLLGLHVGEGAVALQLGGADPQQLADAAKIGQQFGYTEINLNVGCPSDRVQSGSFGACLMAQPQLVAECVIAMREAVTVPVTVKHRIGIDQTDSYEFMRMFVTTVAGGGTHGHPADGPAADAFMVHARKAWLSGLSPKENRTVPPLRYAEVYRLKQDLPHLTVELNGGVAGLKQVRQHLEYVDGVMVGRALYEDPLRFAGADSLIAEVVGEPAADTAPAITPRQVVQRMLPYIEERMSSGAPLHAITRHMLGLFRGRPGGKAWRRALSQNVHLPAAGPQVVEAALGSVPDIVLDSPLVVATQPHAAVAG